MRSALLPATALLLGLAGPALAAPGFATGNVNLRAGPGTNYPQVTVVPAGAQVEIFGCLQGYSWCDVGFGHIRGWVSSNFLQYLYEERRVPLPQYAPQAGVPVVTFQFGNYWRDHYRGRSWYAERDRWGGPPPPRAAFRDPPPPAWRDGPPGRGPEWRDGRADRRAEWRDERRERREEWRQERRERRDDWRDRREDWRDGRGGPDDRGPPGRGRRD
ncbi:SH3 domain-containing protein [Roseomonas sp. SSH11]|uniref:SH3 domain-containing protein n=1 Tax=Pararoseomonas baculiformis TaxID=2820812 RepID=A0ABS4AEY0_9PROT|nr:SH3 domain-containing protein [Pararoseomonas baculiformis]MBP0445546.1 SH3 domain-containing protein [Pararoseomonas baculiformis]